MPVKKKNVKDPEPHSICGKCEGKKYYFDIFGRKKKCKKC